MVHTSHDQCESLDAQEDGLNFDVAQLCSFAKRLILFRAFVFPLSFSCSPFPRPWFEWIHVRNWVQVEFGWQADGWPINYGKWHKRKIDQFGPKIERPNARRWTEVKTNNHPPTAWLQWGIRGRDWKSKRAICIRHDGKLMVCKCVSKLITIASQQPRNQGKTRYFFGKVVRRTNMRTVY